MTDSLMSSNKASAQQRIYRAPPLSLQLKKSDTDGQLFTQGTTRGFIEVEDFAGRHKYLETILRLRGYLQKQEINPGNAVNTPLNITVNFVKAMPGKVITSGGS